MVNTNVHLFSFVGSALSQLWTSALEFFFFCRFSLFSTSALGLVFGIFLYFRLRFFFVGLRLRLWTLDFYFCRTSSRLRLRTLDFFFFFCRASSQTSALDFLFFVGSLRLRLL